MSQVTSIAFVCWLSADAQRFQQIWRESKHVTQHDEEPAEATPREEQHNGKYSGLYVFHLAVNHLFDHDLCANLYTEDWQGDAMLWVDTEGETEYRKVWGWVS